MNQRVKELRKHLQMNQAEFGERLGVTPTAISKIEIGERKLTVQMAKSICNEFNVNPDWLYNGTGEMLREFPSPLMEQFCLLYTSGSHPLNWGSFSLVKIIRKIRVSMLPNRWRFSFW